MQQIRPVFDRIVVRRYEQPEETQGGIFIPQDARAASQLGEVVSVGQGRNIDAPGAYLVWQKDESGDAPTIAGQMALTLGARIEVKRPSMIVSPGDKVLFGKYAGAEVELNGEVVFILREDEILAIVEEVADPVPVEASAERGCPPVIPRAPRRAARKEFHMTQIGVGEGAKLSRAQQTVLDLTSVPAKNVELIQAAIDASVADALVGTGTDAGKVIENLRERAAAAEAREASMRAEFEAARAALAEDRKNLEATIKERVEAAVAAAVPPQNVFRTVRLSKKDGSQVDIDIAPTEPPPATLEHEGAVFDIVSPDTVPVVYTER